MKLGSAVLVHGTWMRPSDWKWVQEPLEEAGLDVVAVDLPSHQGPEAGLLEDAAAVRDTIRAAAPPVVGVGLSYGAFVLAEALTADVDLHRAVFVGSVPRPETEEDYADRSWLDDNPHMFRYPDGTYRSDRIWTLDHGAGRNFPEDVREQLRRTGNRAVSPRTERPMTHEDWRRVPSTVLYGEDDPAVPPEIATMAVERFDEVRVVPGDHFINYRTPEVIVQAVLDAFD